VISASGRRGVAAAGVGPAELQQDLRVPGQAEVVLDGGAQGR
jgi:hypothetical protein